MNDTVKHDYIRVSKTVRENYWLSNLNFTKNRRTPDDCKFYFNILIHLS